MRDELLTCSEVADYYRVDVGTVRRWARKGAIGTVRVGPFRLVRIRRTEAEKHFDEVPGAET